MSALAEQTTEAERVEKLVSVIAELHLDNFNRTLSGRRYSSPLRFRRCAPEDLVKPHTDTWNKGYVAGLTHPQATYAGQLLAKQYNAPLELRSVDTAMEVHSAEKDTIERVEGWEHNREIVVRFANALWAVSHPKVVPVEGRLRYDINGSFRREGRLVRGFKRIYVDEAVVEAGVKLGTGDLFETFEVAGILEYRDDGAIAGGRIVFKDSNYPNVASVRSGTDEWAFSARASHPSDGANNGLFTLELVEKP